jgi:hypothetical protein
MTLVLAELNRYGLLFLDSRTGARSVGTAVARDWSVPHAGCDVFLDIDRPESIRQRLAEVEAVAYRQGHAIAIGHSREHTLDALETWLAWADGQGAGAGAGLRHRARAGGGRVGASRCGITLQGRPSTGSISDTCRQLRRASRSPPGKTMIVMCSIGR